MMKDLSKMFVITKHNKTASHHQCDKAVERFNQTLKTNGNAKEECNLSPWLGMC